MPRPRRVHCRVCGGHIDSVGALSARGKCAGCGEARVVAFMTDQHTMSGEGQRARVAGMLAWAQRELARLGES